MSDFYTLHIGIVGAGNVGWHLGTELHAHGLEFAWVYSRSETSANALASELECEAYHGEQLPERKVDLLLVTVRDAVAEEACKRFAHLGHYLVHTSGSTPLPSTPKQTGGVFYPLQTFTKEYSVRLRGVMCIVDAPNELLRRILVKLGRLLGMNVFETTTPHRQWVHLLGVLSNNFLNHLLTIASTISEREELQKHIHPAITQGEYSYSPMQMLLPLLQQTLEKARDLGPYYAQTGPARRGDINILNQQRAMLSQAPPNFLEVYEALTNSILHHYNTDAGKEAGGGTHEAVAPK